MCVGSLPQQANYCCAVTGKVTCLLGAVLWTTMELHPTSWEFIQLHIQARLLQPAVSFKAFSMEGQVVLDLYRQYTSLETIESSNRNNSLYPNGQDLIRRMGEYCTKLATSLTFISQVMLKTL